MNQIHKDIAEIIRPIAKCTKAESLKEFATIRALVFGFSDYFEREASKINKKRTENYLKEHKGNISEKALVYFNPKEFKELCGAK